MNISFPVESLYEHLAKHCRLCVGIEATKAGYSLHWGDGVANDWQEDYTSLSALLLRLAVLVECADGDADEPKYFASDNEEFQQIATDFLEQQAV